ncbi:MAG: polyamine aminopropyltransferase [Firmicutes bacterium]|nr:polyamine aminopropyltransferase [Bacillota bacterium]
MGMWFDEKHADGTHLRLRVRSVLFQEKTEFQDLAIIETEDFGRALVLDGVLQTTERDEMFYHEMLAHVPLCAHPRPRRVLVVGGGDGGLVREVLRHPTVEAVTMVEIDRGVVEACRRYLPGLSGKLDDPRVEVVFADGVQYVRDCQQVYDVILVDSTDPGGPSLGLFTPDFYGDCHRILADDGFLACQTEEPFFRAEAMRGAYRAVGSVFPVTRLYVSMVPVYSVWYWTFTVGSKGGLDPAEVRSKVPAGTVYYCPDVHRSAFVLPPFIRDRL